MLISTWARRLFLSFWLTIAALFLGRAFFETGAGHPGKIVECRGESYDYLLLFPRDCSPTDPPRPLLVFLHGSGELGKEISVLRRANPSFYADKVSGNDFPFLVACPKGDGPVWEPDRVVAFVDELIAGNLGIDPRRIYLTGFSLGGYGTWQTAAFYPDRFAAVVPVAGDCDPAWAERFGDLPVWAFHGALDRVVLPDGCVETIEILQKIRQNPDMTRLTLYPDSGHGIAGAVYGDAELYRWLLRHDVRSEKNEPEYRKKMPD